jgi:type III secretion protein R
MDALPNPAFVVIGLTLLGLAPFLAILISSFVKLVVVMHIVRSALGLQQAPPNLAINGLAIILSMYIMAPVAMNTYNTFQSYGIEITDTQNPLYEQALTDSVKPIKRFLIKHSDEAEREFFTNTTHKIWPENFAKDITDDHILVLAPAFLITELTEAFEIGFMLYLPFVIIDLIISNILISMGMIMVSPIIISLPFKILLFVLVDGWSRLTHGLILSYQQ